MAQVGYGRLHAVAGYNGSSRINSHERSQIPLPVFHDVACRALLAPAGTLDSGAAVTPACTVYNYGDVAESYSVRMKIGAAYNQTASVSSHAPGTARYVTFPAWSAGPRGNLAVSCSTELSTDAVPANNRQTGSVTVNVHDVGATVLIAPVGAVDSGTTTTPGCTLYNFGSVSETYTARMIIGAGYNNVVTVTGHPAGAAIFVTFPAWTAIARGGSAVSCSTELTTDVRRANDKASGIVTVAVRDVEVQAIVAPTGDVDSGTTLTPQASVRNNGTAAATFPVALAISGGYHDVQTVTSLAPGGSQTVDFTDWSAVVRGAYAVTCTAQLANDMLPANDVANGSGTVAVHDLVAVEITNPTAQVAPGALTPRATLHNAGTGREGATATFMIDATPPYSQTVNLSNGLPVGADTTIEFPDWTAVPGSFDARCSVYLATEQLPVDNVTDLAFQVGEVDVAVDAITYPTGNIDSGLAVVPTATVENLGDLAATFTVYFFIDSTGGSVYTDNATVTGLLPDSSATVTFTEWAKPHPALTYATKCSVYLAGDGNAANDVVTGSFTITVVPPETGWVRKADVPLGAKSKKVKDGGALAYLESATDGDTGYVYAFKGNGRYEFYQFNTSDNVWVTKESIPAVGRAGKKKPVKKGSALVGQDGKVYGAKGNNSLEWWCYDPVAGAWAQKADVSAAAKNLREGTGAVAVTIGDTAYVYLLRGANGTEFLRYNTATDAWETRASAPTGASGKNFKNGSCLAVSDDGKTVFALKGSYNEFFTYSVDSNVWTTKTGMPLIGRLGKKKKVKDGAGMAYHAGHVYAQKGGNTIEFWKYKADTFGGPADVWRQMADVPMGSGRNVKGGGALTYGSKPHPALYEFKGNNTFDFFKYGFGAMTNDQAPMTNAGVQSGASFRTPLSAIRISPNPFSATTTISYSLPSAGKVSLKLYDITGKLVTTLSEGYCSAGSSSFSIQRSALASGIYLVRLDTETHTTTSKLIIE